MTAIAVRGTASVVGLLLVLGCGSGTQASVEVAAGRFSAAVSSGDGAAACALLAPATRQELERTEQAACLQALAAVGLPRVQELAGVQRYGRQGSVVLTGADGERDTYFLSQHGTTWLISAAGCEPQGELPYSCDVEGP